MNADTKIHHKRLLIASVGNMTIIYIHRHGTSTIWFEVLVIVIISSHEITNVYTKIHHYNIL